MKTLTKIACTIAVSLTFSSCGDSSNDSETSSSSSISSSSSVQRSSFCENPQDVEGEMPVMDCRVVSFKSISPGSVPETVIPYTEGLIINEDTLKLWFPHILNEEHRDASCNYFAISIRSGYWILSQDMILYRVLTSEGDTDCGGLSWIIYDAMLVCDDTAEGNLKDRINFNSTSKYNDPDWNCCSDSDMACWEAGNDRRVPPYF
jgi:hypothetical protein